MKRAHWQRYVAIWVIGILLGGSTVLFLYGKEMEEMMLVKKSLEFQNKKLYEENQELKKVKTPRAESKRSGSKRYGSQSWIPSPIQP